MYEIEIKNQQGAAVGKVSVEASEFGGIIRYRLMNDACIMYEANRRVGTACTKDRSMVAGSNKKPWRQKGTGRARAGSRKSPVWRGGGVTHGPKPRSYYYRMPRKALRQALRSAVLSKLRDGELTIIDRFDFGGKPSAAGATGCLAALGLKESTLVASSGEDQNVFLSFRNLDRTHHMRVRDLNCYEVLKYRNLLITQDAFETLRGIKVTKQELADSAS